MAAIVGSKKSRAANFSSVEKGTLVEIALKYESLIENKRTDSVTVREKATAWDNIAAEFNTVSMVRREASQLKQAFENLKKRAKKAAAADKLEKLKTGGGTCVVQVDQTDEKLLSMLGNRAEPLINVYDSDADYYTTRGEMMESLAFTTAILPASVDDFEALNITDAVVPVCTVTENALLSSTAITNTTTATSSSSAPSVLLLTATQTAATSATSTSAVSDNKPKLPALPSRKRRFRPAVVAAKQSATESIEQAATSQRMYYDEKLLMAKKRHEAKMRILALKEQLLKKKIEE